MRKTVWIKIAKSAALFLALSAVFHFFGLIAPNSFSHAVAQSVSSPIAQRIKGSLDPIRSPEYLDLLKRQATERKAFYEEQARLKKDKANYHKTRRQELLTKHRELRQKFMAESKHPRERAQFFKTQREEMRALNQENKEDMRSLNDELKEKNTQFLSEQQSVRENVLKTLKSQIGAN